MPNFRCMHWCWIQRIRLTRQNYSRWRHQMETFSALLAICAGNSPVTGKFPAQMPVTRSFDVSLICAWINGWVNNGDLRPHRAHYQVTVMYNGLPDQFQAQSQRLLADKSMMTSSNGNIFRVTGHLCGEFTGPRWIPHTKASDAELWCLLWSAPG